MGNKKHVSIYKGYSTHKVKPKEHVSAYYEGDPKNEGGILGGIGYTAGRLGLGLAGVVEGAGDIVAAGVDWLSGDKEKAAYRFKDSVTGEWEENLDEWYNPGGGMKFVGDTASGIGQSSVFLLDAVAPGLGTTLFFTGVTGQNISSAAEQTGEVGWKEIGYGVASAGAEAVISKAIGAGGQATKQIGGAVLKSTGKTAAKKVAGTAGKKAWSSVLKETLKSAAGEGVEEAASELLDPQLLKWFKIDEDAETSLGKILYAGAVGAVSGGLMTAGPAAINYNQTVKAGRAVKEAGEVDILLQRAKNAVGGATRAEARINSEKLEGKAKYDEADNVFGRAVSWNKATFGINRRAKKESRQTRQIRETLEKNIRGYESLKEDVRNSEGGDAFLGELLGNVYLLENSYRVDLTEELIATADAKMKQSIVDEINETAKATGQKKTDYTVADFDNDLDGIRRGYASRAVYETILERVYGAENATEAATEAQEDAETATGEEVSADAETAATAENWVNPGKTEDEVILYNVARKLGLDNIETRLLVNTFNKGVAMDAERFAYAFAEGTLYGKYNIDPRHIKENSLLARMNPFDREQAMEAGRISALEQAIRRDKEAEKKKAPERAPERQKKKTYVTLELSEGKRMRDLTETQYMAYKAAQVIGEALHTDIIVHETLGDNVAGKVNGYYDATDNTIHIALDAGQDARGTALFTLAHEVTHYIYEWSPEKFYALSDFVGERMGADMERLISEKVDLLRKLEDYKSMTVSELNDAAHEEVIADAMETILSDGAVMEELATYDKSIWEKVKDFIVGLIEKIKKAYAELSPNSQAAKVLRETVEDMSELQRLWAEGVKEAGERTRTAAVTRVNGEKVQVSRKYSVEYENAEPNQDIIAMVNKVKTGIFKDNEPVELGYISDKNAETIQKLTGINVYGYKMVIEARQIRHILRDHGENGLANQSMSDPNDIAKMEYALENPDTIVNAGKTKAYSYMKNGYNRTADTVRYEKNIGENNYYVIQAVPEAKAKTLFVVGAYIGNQEHKKKASQPASAHGTNHAPDATSENAATNAFGSSISQPEEKVKRKFSVSEEPDAEAPLEDETAKIPDVSGFEGEASEKPVKGGVRELLDRAVEGAVESKEDYEVLAEAREKADAADRTKRELDSLYAKRRDVDSRIKELNGIIKAPKNTETLQWAEREKEKVRQERMEIEKLIEEKKAAVDEANRALFTVSVAERLQKIIRRSEEVTRRKEREKRAESEIGEEVDKLERKLRHLYRRLFVPSKKWHVPPEMLDEVKSAVKATNMDSQWVAKVANLQAELERLEALRDKGVPNTEEIAKVEHELKLAMAERPSIADQMAFALKMYELVGQSDSETISGSFFKEAMTRMKEYQEIVGDTQITKMNAKQIKAANEFYQALINRIGAVNQLFLDAKEASLISNGEGVIEETLKAKAPKALQPREGETSAGRAFKKFFWNMLKPLNAVETIGSKTLSKLFDRVRAGEDVFAVDTENAKNEFQQAAEKYKFFTWDRETRREFKTADGKTVRLTLGEVMCIYALSKRRVAQKNLFEGGTKLSADASEQKTWGSTQIKKPEGRLNDPTRYKWDPKTLKALAETLTKEQKAFADEMQRYLSEDMGKLGNEVSRQLYGFELFGDPHYWPMEIDESVKESQLGRTGDPKVTSKSFTNQADPKSTAPLIIRDFMDVWVNHVEGMSMYHAFALATDDMGRVLNYKRTAVKDSDTGEWTGTAVKDMGDAALSVKDALKRQYGDAAVTYIEKLMRDLNGGIRSDPAASWLDQGLSTFKKTAVAASASVVIQQPSAIARAMAVIDAKHFRVDLKHSKARYEEMQKWVPLATLKKMGGFDTNVGQRTGDYITEQSYQGQEKVKAFFNDKNFRDSLFGYLAGKMDELTWLQIWDAAKRQVLAENNRLKEGSDAHMKAAAELCTRALTETQVYDSTLSRNGFMRSKDTGVKVATSFMAEPTTNFNMLAMAFIRYGRDKNAKTFRKTGGFVLGSLILNSMLASIVYAVRDDDEDETLPEKYVESLTGELLDSVNPLTMMPFLKDIVSITQGYEIERSDMAVVADLWNSVENLVSRKSSTPWYERTVDFAANAGSLFGLPTRNITRDVKGVIGTFGSFFDGESSTARGFGYAVRSGGVSAMNGLFTILGVENEVSNAQQLYDSYVKGDTAHYDRVAARITEKYGEKAVEQTLRMALRDNDKRITTAAIARIEGDLDVYESLVDEIEGEGVFDRNIVIRAVNNEVMDLKEDYATYVGTVPEADPQDDETAAAEGLYVTSDLTLAMERGDAGDMEAIISQMVRDKVDEGKTEKEARASLRSSSTAYWKKRYIAAWEANNATEMRRIRDALEASGLYGNYNEMIAVVRGWIQNSQ